MKVKKKEEEEWERGEMTRGEGGGEGGTQSLKQLN